MNIWYIRFIKLNISSTFSTGYCLGKLWPNGSQMLHGRGTHPIGGAGFDKHGDWMVQAFPNFLDGGSHDDSADSTLFAALSGEHRGTVLWTFLGPQTWLLFFSGRALKALYPKSAGCAWLHHWNPLECSRISKNRADQLLEYSRTSHRGNALYKPPQRDFRTGKKCKPNVWALFQLYTWACDGWCFFRGNVLGFRIQR